MQDLWLQNLQQLKKIQLDTIQKLHELKGTVSVDFCTTWLIVFPAGFCDPLPYALKRKT